MKPIRNKNQEIRKNLPDKVLSLNGLKEKEGQLVNFPNSNIKPIREARLNDLAGLVELWANSATMRYFMDPVRWNWKGKASEIWHDYALDLLQDEKKFLIICDFHDNGLSGFLTARIEELPRYYQVQYSLTVEEIYLRPKDKKAEILKEMIKTLLDTAYKRKQILANGLGISLRIEALESDHLFSDLLLEIGFKKSSVAYTASID